MGNSANETVVYPFTAFNFSVEIEVPDLENKLCNASFSECDGLDMTMEVKTIREGGNNFNQIRLAGPLNYGQLTLKRGMTSNFDIWAWMTAIQFNPALRAKVAVVIFSSDHQKELVRFILYRCLPVRLKAPALNAKDGMVAIEELQIAYEMLKLEKPS